MREKIAAARMFPFQVGAESAAAFWFATATMKLARSTTFKPEKMLSVSMCPLFLLSLELRGTLLHKSRSTFLPIVGTGSECKVLRFQLQP